MRWFRYFMLSFFAIITSSNLAGENGSKSTNNLASIDINKKHQSIEGWGSSLCWWAHEVGQWNDAKIDTLIDLFTDPNKLNMNIFRYNIGGGDDPTHRGGHMVKGKGKRAEMEGFKASPDAEYNWNADAGQRNIMLKIKAKRPDAIFEAFSNSPPYWMTYSGCSAGNNGKYEENLKPEFYSAFCDYLIDVCAHYNEVHDIQFKTLEPFNEPTSGYWKNLGGQEGSYFSAETQMQIIDILYPKLKASGLNTVISASDETNIASFIKVFKAYKKQGETLQKIGQLNTHSYQGTTKQRKLAQKLVEPTGINFWQSESGPMGLGKPAKGLENNLLLTQKLFDDMRYMKPSAWLDWQLMEENNDTWGQVICNFKAQEYRVLKNLYVRMQITRFFKQGYTLVDTNNDAVLAALSPNGNTLVFAVLNTNTSKQEFKLNIKGYSNKHTTTNIYRTSKNENCEQINGDYSNNSDTQTYKAPALSLTTFILKTEN